MGGNKIKNKQRPDSRQGSGNISSAREQTANYQTRIVAELEALPDTRLSKFTEFEDEIVRRFYPTKGSKPIAEKLGKTPRQIKGRAALLHIKRIQK